MLDRARIVSNLLGVIGAIAGGVFGYVIFWWIVRQGFYALILPGAMLGLGCGLLARHASMARGVLCALAGLGLGLYTDWTFEQFPADPSFSYYLTHLQLLRPITLLMVGLGGVIAYWLGKDGGFGRPSRGLR
jgi:hypothetical protein